jgi:diaminopimelate epimerase
MKCWHMSGAGNDFMVIDARGLTLDFEKMALELCAKTGADGFMAVDYSEIGDFKLHFYNSDGSRGEMCGNGSRCICRFAYDLGIAGESMVIEADAGPVPGWRLAENQYRVKLNNPTTLEPERIPGVAYVELGNPGLPHAVVPYHNLKNADENELRDLGRKIRWHKDFPKGANVNFYEIIGEDLIYERTFERGVEDFTYACGTGTGSVVTVLTLQGKVSGSGVRVDMAGGQLIIDAEREGSVIRDLYLTGPTNIVAKGEVTDEDLRLA